MRSGKSHAMALVVAKAMREGQKVVLASHDGEGRLKMEKIVCVPGYNDGTQLTNQSAIVEYSTLGSSNVPPLPRLDTRNSDT